MWWSVCGSDPCKAYCGDYSVLDRVEPVRFLTTALTRTSTLLSTAPLMYIFGTWDNKKAASHGRGWKTKGGSSQVVQLQWHSWQFFKTDGVALWARSDCSALTTTMKTQPVGMFSSATLIARDGNHLCSHQLMKEHTKCGLSQQNATQPLWRLAFWHTGMRMNLENTLSERIQIQFCELHKSRKSTDRN